MRNKIDILRALYFDENDYRNILNAGDDFPEKEREFMLEFKKIYELGLRQLEKFMMKLKDEGAELEVWDIVYYVNQLLNGPLRSFAIGVANEEKIPYFADMPKSMGTLGNKSTTNMNTTVCFGYPTPLNVAVDSFNSAPGFMHKNLGLGVFLTEELFKLSLASSVIIDNTLPLADKKPQDRYKEEPTGEWVKKSNASYLVKDSLYLKIFDPIRSQIFEKVKEVVGEENFRIYLDNKLFNPFNPDYNTSATKQFILKKKIGETEIETDLFGAVYDSFEKRKVELQIPQPESDKKYKLNTNQGQLGNDAELED